MKAGSTRSGGKHVAKERGAVVSQMETGESAQSILAVSDMHIELWPTEKPIDYARNARRWGAQAIAKVAASIREFGFVQPVVVDKEGVIIIGHLRRAAARTLKLEQIPVLVADQLSPAQVKALRLMDNRSHEEAVWDQELLGPELMELGGLDIDLKLTGFDRDEVQSFVLEGWDPAEEEAGAASESGAGLEFRIVVDCESENRQAELLRRLEEEGLKCRALSRDGVGRFSASVLDCS